MGNHFGYTINGPRPETTDQSIRVSNPPVVKRDLKLSGNNLRNLYQNPRSLPRLRSSLSSTENGVHNSATPVLPPTPPNIEDDSHGSVDDPLSSSEAAKARSMLVTPVNQMSPPTPDYTPPREMSRIRYHHGARQSMTSSRAESFKTAHEDLSSDKVSISTPPALEYDSSRPSPLLGAVLANGVFRPSPLANLPITNSDLISKEFPTITPSSAAMPFVEPADHASASVSMDKSCSVTAQDLAKRDTSRETIHAREQATVKSAQHHSAGFREGNPQRERSLRERIEHSQQTRHSPSMDKFASIIGWTNGVRSPEDEQRRWSGASNTSTVEAFLIEQPRLHSKRNTLRHVSKNESLRSVSSPLPISNRTSLQSSSASPHRLVHKKAKLNNQNRLSFESEASASVSQNVRMPIKEKEVEVIKVAVIPERSSSLHQSSSSSRRHSFSTTGAPTSYRVPRTLENAQSRQRAHTDITDGDRGRRRYHPPQVPLRGSSLSAPTSRNTSRANSITSDHVHFERKRAEKDLRSTLDRMESERLASSLKSASLEHNPLTAATEVSGTAIFQESTTKLGPSQDFMNPGSMEWAEFRPSPTLHTPFSQPSFMSASPEISEAKLISLHLHNNHSVQLIEPFPLHESHAVEETRKLNKPKLLGSDHVDSPLRNPRNAPHPPQVHFTLATSNDVVRNQDGNDAASVATPATPTRPAARPRTDSFAKSLLRSVSLKHARNKKASQDLDETLNPFWRPQPFWNNIEGGSPEKQGPNDHRERGLVNNSLGLPQQRIVVAGPLALVRKFSERRQNRRTIARQSSYNSLQRLRAGRKLHRFSGLGFPMQIKSLRDIQTRVSAARQRREDEQREKRRDALRKSIGANVIATGDSRFPSSTAQDDWPLT